MFRSFQCPPICAPAALSEPTCKRALARFPVPFFSLGNIKDIDDIGPHTYNSGALALKGYRRRSL